MEIQIVWIKGWIIQLNAASGVILRLAWFGIKQKNPSKF